MTNSETTGNARKHQQVPLRKNKSFWHITILMIAFTAFYYMDVIINLGGSTHLKWDIFYTVHDLHRALFLIPAMYAAYEFRLRGIAVTSFISFLIFLPRALVVSPYPDPLFRALIFMVSMVIMGILLAKLLNNISEQKVLVQDLSRTQNDLTHIKEEEALRESEDKYKSLIDNIPDIIFTIDLEGKITFVSKRNKEILGYENEETINMNIFDFIPEEDHQRAIENLQKGMTGEKIRHFQIPMMAKSGERLIFECSFSRIYKDGKVIGAQGTATDITARKRAEESAQNARSVLQSVQDALSFYIAILDGAAVIVQVNKAWRNFGKQNDLQHPNSCIGQSYLDVCEQASGPDSEEALLVAQAIRNVLAGRQDSVAIEYPCHAPREKRWFVVHITSFDDNHRWIVLAHENITGRKQIEEEMRNLNENMEQTIKERTTELNETIDLLEETNRAFVGREMRIIELKEQIAEMEKQKT